MLARITIANIAVDVDFKDVKNVHLVVHPPHGRVTISAPARMDVEAVRAFALTKLSWIRQQQRKLQKQPRETEREFWDRESHFVWGERYLLRVVPVARGARVEFDQQTLKLHVPLAWSVEKKADVLGRWYRMQVRSEVDRLLPIWVSKMGIITPAIRVQRMKTKWGSCNHRSGSILLNTELAKKPRECLEYVLVHELVHLLEATHGERFNDRIARLMPNWRLRRDRLNELPIGHQEWGRHPRP